MRTDHRRLAPKPQPESKQPESKQLTAPQPESKQLTAPQPESKQLTAPQPESKQLAAPQPELPRPESKQLRAPQSVSTQRKYQAIARSTPPTPAAERVPGALFVSGRYRLLERCGSAPDTEFWRAHDLATGQDVALTVVDFEACGPATATAVEQYFGQTVWLGRVRSEALAPVLDMVGVQSLAVVVSEWLPSSSLAEVAASGPSEAGVASALLPLACGVRDAHRRPERVVALQDPSRIRVSSEGIAYLAFPGAHSNYTRTGDVRGLAAAWDALGAGTRQCEATSADGIVRSLRDVVAQAQAVTTQAEAVTTQPAVPDPELAVPEPAVPEPAVPEPAPGLEPAPAAVPGGDRPDVNVWAFVAISVLALVILGLLGWFVGTSLA